MSTAQAQPSTYNPLQRIASPVHLSVVLATMAALGYWGHFRMAHLRAAEHPNRVVFYVQTIFREWLLLAIVLVGVRLQGSSLRTVVGDRWRSVREAFRDFGIGFVFLLLTLVMIMTVGPLLGMTRGNAEVQGLLPRGPVESALWVAICISAGFCEEAVFRGYLQRQLISFSSNIPIGMLLSALAFGAAHLYQGLPRASVIVVGGVMCSILAHWRKSVRPGMFAHFLQDLLPFFIRH
jgi:uncharacterized protein